MDTAVALVQAYLNTNGYFTVVEYPVLEAVSGSAARSVTDLDMLALRFAGVGDTLLRQGAKMERADVYLPDPILQCPVDRPDMIVGEVKEGTARFNRATRKQAVLEVALARFGCCSTRASRSLARTLLQQGYVDSPAGHRVRMVAFGNAPDTKGSPNWTTVPMAHVVQFLRAHLRRHWTVLRHAQIKDPTLGLLALLEKWRPDGRSPPQR
jgi:hypothetical protein